MSLTLEQASAAGALASRIIRVQKAISNLQAAIAAGEQISAIDISLLSGGSLRWDVELSPEYSSALIEGALTVFNAILTDSEQELGGIIPNEVP